MRKKKENPVLKLPIWIEYNAKSLKDITHGALVYEKYPELKEFLGEERNT